jgi:hypothetical protein
MRAHLIAPLCTILLLSAACSDSPAAQDEPLIIIDEEDDGGHHHHGPDMIADQDMATETPDMAPDDGGLEPAPLLIEGELTYTSLHKATQANLLTTGLAFNPQQPDQLWLMQRWPVSEARCDSERQTNAGCAALEGSVTIISGAGTPQQAAQRRTDPNGWHFMRRPTAIAFGVNNTFATCGEERTGNYLDESADFIGPTLWSSDLSIFAMDPGLDENGDPLNGSHLDMLHETPYCMGIAHEAANIYWTFNGKIGSLDRYNFNADHGPGHDNHADGELYRYVVGQLKREPNIPSHMAYDKTSGMLYVADTGNARVVRLDTASGTVSGSATPVYEPLAVNQQIAGADLAEIVAPGTLTHPSGLVIHQGTLYVGDNATGQIHAFDLDGTPRTSIQTPLAAGALGALHVGPDKRLYIVDMLGSEVWRLDPK